MGMKAFNKANTTVERHLIPHLRYANQGGIGAIYEVTTTTGYVIAGEDINEGQAFYIGSDGLAYKSSNIEGKPCHGIIAESGSLNSQLPYVASPEYKHSTYNFTPGADVWLTDGMPNISTEIPPYDRHYVIQRIGRAKTTDTILLDISDEYIVE
jgi:hypothetical protein